MPPAVTDVKEVKAKAGNPNPRLGEEVLFSLDGWPQPPDAESVAGQVRPATVTRVWTDENTPAKFAGKPAELGLVNLTVLVGTIGDTDSLARMASEARANSSITIPGSWHKVAVRYDATGAPGTWHREGEGKK